jgi:hypothetical protein
MDYTALHAHVDRSSADCDGPMYDSHVETYNDDEIAEAVKANGINDFSEIHFRERVLTSNISVYSCMQGTLEVSENGFSWNESTEEGYRTAHVRWCRDDCDTDERSHRDVYAEMMNY